MTTRKRQWPAKAMTADVCAKFIRRVALSVTRDWGGVDARANSTEDYEQELRLELWRTRQRHPGQSDGFYLGVLCKEARQLRRTAARARKLDDAYRASAARPQHTDLELSWDAERYLESRACLGVLEMALSPEEKRYLGYLAFETGVSQNGHARVGNVRQVAADLGVSRRQAWQGLLRTRAKAVALTQ